MSHLVFYDGKCGVCDWIVQHIIKWDKKKQFLFAPLGGKTAAAKNLPKAALEADSLILIENYNTSHEKIHIYGKAAFKIFWLLRGGWKLLGWPCFLPPFLYNWAYRLFAHYRHKVPTKNSCSSPDHKTKDRFLK